jgi:hypothetical protein
MIVLFRRSYSSIIFTKYTDNSQMLIGSDILSQSRELHILFITSDKYVMKTKKSIKAKLNEAKKTTFIDSPEWTAIVNNIQTILTSDGTMNALLDFERVIDNADVYAFKNWRLGELVDGPIVKRYDITCTFMWPTGLMPDPRGAKRLLPLGCQVGFKKIKIKVPIEIKRPSDFKPGTHYPRMIDREVWLVNIVMPRRLMDDIRDGTIEIADQNIDLEDLDRAYEKDYDKSDANKTNQAGQPPGMPGGPMGGPPGMSPSPGLPPI